MPLVTCPQCQEQVEIEAGWYGRRVACPECQYRFTARRPSDDEPDEYRVGEAPDIDPRKDERDLDTHSPYPPRRRRSRYVADDRPRSGNKVLTGIVGTLVVTSWVVPEVVGAFCCYAFFNGGGMLNAILSVVGLKGPDWLYVLPMASVILANIWRGTAFSMMVYSAAITEVPEEVTESAELDGASGWKRLIYITIPMIRRSIWGLAIAASAFSALCVPGTFSTTSPSRRPPATTPNEDPPPATDRFSKRTVASGDAP